jgi:hypothetical protein
MAIKMIRPESIAFKATVTEEEIRARMVQEVLEGIGGLGPDGKPLPGIRTHVTRNPSRAGGYNIEITGPMPARIMLPGPAPLE